MPRVCADSRSRSWMAAALVAAALGLAIAAQGAVDAGHDSRTVGDGKGGTYRTQTVSPGHEATSAAPAGTLT